MSFAQNPGCFQKIGVFPPKWMVKIMETLLKWDDLGGKPIIFGNTLLDSLHFIFLPKIVPFLVFENSVFAVFAPRFPFARSTKQRWSRWASDLTTKPRDFSEKNSQFWDLPFPSAYFKGWTYLEDHPMTCKWLITMVIVSPLNGVIPLPNGLNGL